MGATDHTIIERINDRGEERDSMWQMGSSPAKGKGKSKHQLEWSPAANSAPDSFRSDAGWQGGYNEGQYWQDVPRPSKKLRTSDWWTGDQCLGNCAWSAAHTIII